MKAVTRLDEDYEEPVRIRVGARDCLPGCSWPGEVRTSVISDLNSSLSAVGSASGSAVGGPHVDELRGATGGGGWDGDGVEHGG